MVTRVRPLRLCLLLSALAAALLAGCDRNLGPYEPGEEPRQPDLSKIFPAGAEESSRMAGRVELPDAPTPRGGRGADPSADALPIEGVIRVSDALAGSLPSGAVLFLIARTAATGPPLAVQRINSPSFPLRFSLGPGDRMIPTIPFAGQLQLSARLDLDGNAGSRTPGDIQGQASAPQTPGSTGVEIVLDQVL